VNIPRKISDILPSICPKILKSVEIFLSSDKNKCAQFFLKHGVHQGGTKNRNPVLIFAITSVNVHRF